MNRDFTQRLALIEQALNRFFFQNRSETPYPQTGYSPAAGQLLADPCTSLILSGGKRWRPLVMVLGYEHAGGTNSIIYQLAPLIEGIHTASLIHDDIEDGSVLRRGQPAAHISFGLDSALNAGSWLYFKALSCIAAAPLSENITLDLYTHALNCIIALHEGQALDIQWHRTPDFFPSQDEYQTMIRGKTGALAGLAAYCGFRSAEKTSAEAEAFAHIIEKAGAAFQIADDIKNITAGNAGKKRGDDIVEGKKSLPVIFYIEEHSNDKDMIAALFKQAQDEGIDSPAVEKVISILHSSKAIEAAETEARRIIQSCVNGLHELYGTSASIELLINLLTAIQKA